MAPSLFLVRPAGLEPASNRYDQLSYGRLGFELMGFGGQENVAVVSLHLGRDNLWALFDFVHDSFDGVCPFARFFGMADDPPARIIGVRCAVEIADVG